MFKYSEQLRIECIVYFRDVRKVEINEEKADMYLDSLATLCEAMLDLDE